MWLYVGVSIVMAIVFVHPFEVTQLRNAGHDVGVGTAMKEEVANLVDIIKNERSVSRGTPNILVFNFIAGLYLSFYPTFMNKLIQKSLPIDTS